VAPRKRDGAGSTSVGIAHNGEGSVLGSMLVLGRTLDVALKALPMPPENSGVISLYDPKMLFATVPSCGP
jgi:hypothetical protein